MANPSLAEIATALRNHIIEGTTKVDFLNANPYPAAHLTSIIHDESFTPATSTPQSTTAAHDQRPASVYSKGCTPAPQLDGPAERQGSVDVETAYLVSLASHNHRKRKPPPRPIAPKKAPRMIKKNHNTRKGLGSEVEAVGECASENGRRENDPIAEAAKKALVENRKALVDTMEAYQDIVKEIQKKAREGRHYGSNGIVAMLPAKLAESRLRGDDRIATVIGILDLIRPDLRSQKLELCSRVIDTIAGGKCPNEETLTELDDWAGK
ncbi:MAG: hypothetical protein ASARMPRED_003302 [Alectoria sarmentosa]|nr:MAG: hypothetical protein ASARMPRED_003302 [Alectoria sarmentosa]